jgi:hypothetical protein
MEQTMASRIVPTIALTDIAPTAEPDTTALRTLAGSVIHEFKERGYRLHHIIVLASELVGLACEAVRYSGTPTTKA